MKAIQITAFGGPDVMNYVDLADPVAGNDEVVLDVTAVGINYADTHQTENSYLSPQTLPMIPGIEVVGTHGGKRYLASVSSGGYAQKAVAHKSVLFPIPDALTDQQALCMLVQGATAWHLLKTMGNIQKGQSVVVHAAAGGVAIDNLADRRSRFAEVDRTRAIGRDPGDDPARGRRPPGVTASWPSSPRSRACSARSGTPLAPRAPSSPCGLRRPLRGCAPACRRGGCTTGQRTRWRRSWSGWSARPGSPCPCSPRPVRPSTHGRPTCPGTTTRRA